MEKYIVKLTKAERAELLLLIKKGKAAAYKLTHARILLGVDESEHNEQPQTDLAISQVLHIDIKTVKRIRKRCVEEGVDAAILRKRHSKTKPNQENLMEKLNRIWWHYVVRHLQKEEHAGH